MAQILSISIEYKALLDSTGSTSIEVKKNGLKLEDLCDLKQVI